jgi:hypothetical protein
MNASWHEQLVCYYSYVRSVADSRVHSVLLNEIIPLINNDTSGLVYKAPRFTEWASNRWMNSGSYWPIRVAVCIWGMNSFRKKERDLVIVFQCRLLHGRWSGSRTGFFQISSVFPCQSPVYHCFILICHCPTRCAMHLTREHIIISSGFKFGTSSLARCLAGYRVRKFWGSLSSFLFIFMIDIVDGRCTL